MSPLGPPGISACASLSVLYSRISFPFVPSSRVGLRILFGSPELLYLVLPQGLSSSSSACPRPNAAKSLPLRVFAQGSKRGCLTPSSSTSSCGFSLFSCGATVSERPIGLQKDLCFLWHACRNIYFTSQEYRDVLTKYLEARDAKREDGQDARGNSVALDPLLAEAGAFPPPYLAVATVAGCGPLGSPRPTRQRHTDV